MPLQTKQETAGSRSGVGIDRAIWVFVGKCLESPSPLPQATPVSGRTYTLPRLSCGTTGPAIGVLRRQLATSDRQRKVPLLQSVMEHLFHYLLLCLNRRTICSTDNSKCALLSLTQRINERTRRWTGPSCGTFGGMCTPRGHGSPHSRRRATITRKTKKRTG